MKKRGGKSIHEVNDQLDKAAEALYTAAWSCISAVELDNQSAFRIRKTYEAVGAQSIAKELYVLHMLFDILKQIADPAMEQIRNGLEAMKKQELAQPVKLALPLSRYEYFRRQLLKSLFDAVKVLGTDGERHDLNLGYIWFASPDDAPILKASADALTHMKE